MRHIPHFIHGRPLPASKETLSVLNPATGKPIATLNPADRSIVNQAVESALQAFATWSKIPIPKRARLMLQFRALLEKNRKMLAEIITLEHGKTLSDAEGSVDRGIEVAGFAAGIADHLMGDFAVNIAGGTDNYSLRVPLGVCAGITPFNFPAMIPLWMFPIAIAAGNTFILKPSEKDPSCAVRLAELVLEAGIPPGVVNVVQGASETVQHILKHPDIRAISFVGSSAVAKEIYHTGILAGKRVQAFGGAKNHCLVLPDVDLDRTAETLTGAAFGSAGERCMAISVVVMVGDTHFADSLTRKICQRVKDLRIGAGNLDNIDMGPLISSAHRDKILAFIQAGITEGASLVVDGRSLHTKENGFFMGGCVFDHVTPDMSIWQEEIFGPVLCLMRAPDYATGLRWINSHPYGNGAAIFTGNPALARQFAMDAQAGMVGINIPIPVPVSTLSFGGWKQSRFGDIHLFGPEGVQFYTQLKTIMQRWPEESLTSSGFLMPTH